MTKLADSPTALYQCPHSLRPLTSRLGKPVDGRAELQAQGAPAASRLPLGPENHRQRLHLPVHHRRDLRVMMSVCNQGGQQ